MENQLFNETIAQIERGRLVEPHEKLMTLHAQNENDHQINYCLGLLSLKWDRYDEAIEFLSRAIVLKEDDYRLHEAIGQAYGLKAQHVGLVKAALLIPRIKKSFQRALELNSKSTVAHEGLFMFYLFTPGMAGGDEQKALELAEQLKAINAAHGQMAMALYETRHGEISKAQLSFDSAVELAPDDAEIQLRAGRFFLEKKDFERAGQLFDRYSSLRSEDAAGYTMKGECLLKNKQYEQALEQFQVALEKNPTYLPACLQRAETLAALNMNDEAKAAFQNIIDQHGKTPFAERARQALAKL